MIPGEYQIQDGDIELNAGRRTLSLTVANSGDRPIQVGSHYHFHETNDALVFDRALSRGMRLNIAAGTAVRFEPGRIEFSLAEGASRTLAQDLSRTLKDWTGQTWMVAVVNAEGGATLREQVSAAKGRRESDAAAHPSVRAVMERFPGARIVDVRDPRAAEAAQAGMAASTGDDYLPDGDEPLFDDAEPDFDGVDF